MKQLALSVGVSLLLGLPGAVIADDVVGSNDELEVIAPESVEAEDMPMGQSVEGEDSLLPEDTAGGAGDDNILGMESGYVHPSLLLEEYFTDNVFNESTDESSSWVTRISPSIWVTLPRKKEIPVDLAARKTAPGGLALQIDDYQGGDKFQLYGLARADLYSFSDDSDYNYENYDFEGLGRYNMASGLSLQILDRYAMGNDIFDTGSGATAENIREFDSNLLMLTADWDMTEKLRFKIDYSLFDLAYSDNVNNFLERQDDIIDLYGFYKYSVKTSLFLQYRYADVEYDSASAADNSQDSYFAGVRYNSTDKLALMFKAGIQDKSFNRTSPGFEDSSNLSLDLQAEYKMTEKTRITLDMYRNNEESNSQDASEREVLGAWLLYEQDITEKIIARIDGRYENADYTQLPGQGKREDDYYFIRPAVQYLFRDWMMGEVGYSFEKTSSSDSEFDFETNVFSVSLFFTL